MRLCEGFVAGDIRDGGKKNVGINEMIRSYPSLKGKIRRELAGKCKLFSKVRFFTEKLLDSDYCG
jgi:hypothetical protein